MGFLDMVIQMFLTFPFFNEMKYPGNLDISNQFVPDASCFLTDCRGDIPDFPDKIIVPFRHNSTLRINKYHICLLPH